MRSTRSTPYPPTGAHLDVVDAQALEDRRREDAARKRAAEDVFKLAVEAADAEGLKGERAALEQLVGRKALLARDLDGGLACVVLVCV